MPAGAPRLLVQVKGRMRKNGELIRSAVATGFVALLTPDRNLEYQQDITRAGLAVVVVRAHTNRIEDIRPLVPQILDALRTVRRSTVIHVGV